MMLDKLAACCLVLALWLAPLRAHAAETPAAPDLINARDDTLAGAGAMALFGAMQYEEHMDVFEKAAAEFRTKKLRLSTGEWKLSALYNGVMGDAVDPRWDPLLERWRKKYPESPTPYIVRAQLLWQGVIGRNVAPVYYSIQSRNQDVAAEKAKEIKAYLEANRAIASRDPHWFDLMARAGMMSGQDEAGFSATIVEGLIKEPTYYVLYESGADYFLQNGGNSAALERWARQISAIAAISGADSAYARIYSYAFYNRYGWNLFRKTRIDWEHFKSSANAMLATDYSDRNLGRATLMACLANDHAETKRLVDTAAGSLDFYPWAGPKEREQCLAWANKPAWRIRLDAVARAAAEFLMDYLLRRFGLVEASQV